MTGKIEIKQDWASVHIDYFPDSGNIWPRHTVSKHYDLTTERIMPAEIARSVAAVSDTGALQRGLIYLQAMLDLAHQLDSLITRLEDFRRPVEAEQVGLHLAVRLAEGKNDRGV